ncbi:hypothetical protein [Streptomyces sp. HUAS TT20]|uniref:hypothetical protein n=1 Tax=Streptomyces sp. HUAS TT20 TaxID=3447509 RepID=UPI0021DB0668|nr:hypothetical protein [Streptomyces sp. HUAS 15-9]UXY31669.1 hypothetical protein N8I87_37410 [Streptomyces sp. HUAS 15-9]
MKTLTPARALMLVTAGIACLVTASGGLLGALLGGWIVALVAGAVAGAGSVVGALLVRRRAMAGFSAARREATTRGSADGIAHGVLVGVANYQAAVFPMNVGGVTDEERAARRTVAYRLAAEDEVPHPVRQAAANALAALDDEDLERVRDAMSKLYAAVHDQVVARGDGLDVL